MLRHWPTLRYRRMLGCADVGLAGRDRRVSAGPVIAEPHETLVRPVIAERQETVVFVQLIRVDQTGSPVGFYSGHHRGQRCLLIPVIPRTGRARAHGYVRACLRRRPRVGAQLGLRVRQRLMRQVPGVGTAPQLGPGLRSVLSRLLELAFTGVPGLGLSGVLGLAFTGVPGLGLTGVLGLAFTGVPGLAALGLRLWPRGPRTGRAATRRCAPTVVLPSRPVLSHDPVHFPDDSLNALT